MGISLTRDTILDNVWGIDYYGDLRTVDTNIKSIFGRILNFDMYRLKISYKGNYLKKEVDKVG